MTTTNELPSHPLTHLDGVVHDRPVVDAHEVFTVLDESPTDSGPHDSVAIRDASDAEASLNALLVAWEAVMAHIADRSAIAQDHPLIHALMDALIAHGLLPASGDISRDDVIQFHDWLVGMPTDALVEDKALIEVWVLANWGAANHGGGLDQVTLTGAINTFQQYTVHAHVTVDGQVLTLSCLDPEPVTVDHALHATGQQLFRQVWGDPSPQDYRQAHEALTLSDDDQAQFLQWFQSTFPDGLDGLSALAMIEAILQAMVAEDPQYVPDIGDTWATVSEFLASKSGDCEDFSHFLYAALRHAFSALPIEDQPELSVVAGLVGQGAYVLGHSVLEVTIGEEAMVIDLTRAVVGDANPVLRAVDYRRQVQFQEVLRYDATETTVRATDVDLASFSTASVGGDADTFVDYVDGVLRESSATSPSYLYQTLMTDVIAEETRTLTQQQGIFSSPDDALVGVSDLESFSVVNFFSDEDYVNYFLDRYGLDLSDICQMNDQLMMAKGRGRVSRSVFSFLGSNMDRVLSDLDRFGYIQLGPESFVLNSFGEVERTNGDLFDQLIAMGILTPYGEIDGDQLTNSSTLNDLRDLFRLSIGSHEYVSEQADHLIAYLRNKHYVFSSTGGAYNGDSVFGQTLSQFEALTERLFKGFSGSVVGVERDALSDIGQSEFVTSEPGSLFLRTQHQAIQEAMSLFFSLQNKISAFMTVIFSLADMTSSISTKLGEEHSTASSTSRQRQKIVQTFNAYSGGINASLNTMMDMFEKSVQKVNDARYQTGLNTLENHYKNVRQSLVNIYLAEQSTIEHDQLKMAMSQDYYRMLADNRKSMQSAMVDVPQFGPNITPSMFSGLLLDQPQYKGLTSIQLWSQLLAKGVIDEHGMLTDAYQSPDAIASTLILSSSNMDPGITIDSDDDAAMASFKTFLQQELQQFQAWESSVGSADVLREVRDWVANRLMAHARATCVTGPVGPGLHLAHPGLASFSSSAMIPHVMQFMARASDDFYSDPRITGVMPSHGLDDVWHTVHVGAQHNRFNELMLTPADWEDFFKKFESEPVELEYPIYFNQLSYDDEAGVKQVMELSLYQRQEISRVLTQCKEARTPSIRDIWDQLSHIFDGENDPFKDALKDKLMLVGYLNDQYILGLPSAYPYGLSYEFLTTHINEEEIGDFSELISTELVALANGGEILRNSLVNKLRVLLADKESLFKDFSPGEDFSAFLYHRTLDGFNVVEDENSFVVQLLRELEHIGYIFSSPNELYTVNSNPSPPVVRQLESERIIQSVINQGILVDDGHGTFTLHDQYRNRLLLLTDDMQRALPDVPRAVVELMAHELQAMSQPNALHLSQSAATADEPGSGFQRVNFEMVALAQKNFMLMNTLRRIYMTMVSAQTQFFEKIASKLSQDAVASSHHSEWPASLMESHIRLADRQLSSIHSLTSQMVSRINDLHKLRLNLVKLSDPLKRIFNLSSDYSGLAGAVLMLAPSPLLKGLGMLFSMVSLGIGLAESWRSRDIEYQLDQRMAEYGDWFNSAQVSSNDFFSANLLAPTDDSDFQSSVGPAGDLVVSDLPRAVVDYANAHLYLNPQADHVQGLLPQVFPNGVPSDPAAIINAVHAFMMQSTRYVSDGDHDVWSDVNDVAVSLEGDCEDLINLEHSLLLAAFDASGQPYPTPVNHAAYVMQDGQRVGHVFMTIEVNGETMVLDPSLETGMVPYSEYQQNHGVECVFTYTADQTHVIDPSALGIQTSTGISGVLDGFLSNLVDDDGLTSFFDGFVMSPGATDEDMIHELNSRMIDSVMDAIEGSGGLFGDIAGIVMDDVLQLDAIMKSFLPGGGLEGVVKMGDDLAPVLRVLDPISPLLEGLFGDLSAINPQSLLEGFDPTAADWGIAGGDGIQGAIESAFGRDTIQSSFSSEAGPSGVDTAAGQETMYPIYFNQLSYVDEAGVKQVMELSLYQRQEISRVLTQCKEARTPSILHIWDQLSHIFDGETDPFKDALKDKLMLVGYLNDQYILNLPPANPYGLSYEFLTTHIKEDKISDFSELISTLLVELADGGEILRFSLVNELIVLLDDQDSLFNRQFSSDQDFDDFLYHTTRDGFIVVADEDSFIMQLLTELEDTLHYITRSTSDGGGHYIINTFTMDRPPTLRSDYSATIESLLAQQSAARNDMMVASDQDLRNRFLEGVDKFGQRVVVNKIQIESYKDAIRITQEKLRLVFLLTKIMSDALSTLAANIGDQQKEKVASGLQQLFESSFELVNLDVRFQEQLISHVETAINHNVQVEKVRFNKAYDFAFKMVVAAPSMLAPKFAHWIHGVANVLETILLHYDSLGDIHPSMKNEWSEYYLDTNFFTPDGFTQRWGQARFDLTTEHQRSLFQLHDPALNELVYLRASSFEWLNKATKIQPIREDRVGLVSTMLTGELNGAAPQRLVVDYDAFSMYRNKILNKGIKAQSQLSVIIARTSYLSTLTKSIRGDGKVGGQHLSGALDLIERQVMHDTDTLNDIQSLQQESVRLHNSHIDALEKIEKSVIEGVAMAGYFGLYFFKPALLQGVLGLMSIVLVKTLANMVHGALIAYRTDDSLKDRVFNTPARVNPPVAPVMVQKNEFDRDVYQKLLDKGVLSPVGNDRAEVMVSTSDVNDTLQLLGVSPDVLSKTKSTLYQALDRDKAIGYFNGGVLAPMDYSAVASQESEYLDRTFSEDAVILDSTSHFFGSKSATEFLGFGYQSINQYEYAAQHLHLKRLFTQWDLILTSGQSVAEAIQSLADDLGAVVSSMAYSRFIRSSMALKKSVMTANLDARYSMIDAVISLFNRIQKERRETVLQFVKGVVVGLVAKGIQKRRAFNAKQSLDLTRHASDKSSSFKKLNVFSPRFLGKGKSVGLSIFVQFAENMVQLVVWAFRKVQLERMRLNRKDLLSDALIPFQAGSSAEAVVYFATLQKAGQSVDSDLISEIKFYERYLSIIVQNLVRKWQEQARKVARAQTDEDASFVKEKEALFGKDMLKGDLTSANDWLQEVSAYLDPPTSPHSGRGAPSLFDSRLIGRSIRLDGGIWKVTGEEKIGTQKILTVSQYSETQTLVIDQQTNAVYVDRRDSTSANQWVKNHLFGGESVFDINIEKDGIRWNASSIQKEKNGAIAVMINPDQGGDQETLRFERDAQATYTFIDDRPDGQPNFKHVGDQLLPAVAELAPFMDDQLDAQTPWTIQQVQRRSDGSFQIDLQHKNESKTDTITIKNGDTMPFLPLSVYRDGQPKEVVVTPSNPNVPSLVEKLDEFSNYLGTEEDSFRSILKATFRDGIILNANSGLWELKAVDRIGSRKEILLTLENDNGQKKLKYDGTQQAFYDLNASPIQVLEGRDWSVRNVKIVFAKLSDGDQWVRGVVYAVGLSVALFLDNLRRSVGGVIDEDRFAKSWVTAGVRQSSSIWASIEATRDQMMMYGGQTLLPEFDDAVRQLRTDVAALSDLSRRASGTSSGIAEQVAQLRTVSDQLKVIAQLAGQFDDYKTLGLLGKLKQRFISSNHKRLTELSANVQSFAIFATASTAVSLNRPTLTQQQLRTFKILESFQWLEAEGQKSPERVYQPLGDFFAQMSHHDDGRKHRLFAFFKEALETGPTDGHKAMVAKKILASRKTGADYILNLISHIHVEDKTMARQLECLSHGSEGIVALARQFKNDRLAKRLIYGWDVGSLFRRYINPTKNNQQLMTQWMAHPTYGQFLAKQMAELSSVDEITQHGLAQQQRSPLATVSTFMSNFFNRLKKTSYNQQFNNMVQDITLEGNDDQKRIQFLGLLQFALSLKTLPKKRLEPLFKKLDELYIEHPSVFHQLILNDNMDEAKRAELHANRHQFSESSPIKAALDRYLTVPLPSEVLSGSEISQFHDNHPKALHQLLTDATSFEFEQLEHVVEHQWLTLWPFLDKQRPQSQGRPLQDTFNKITTVFKEDSLSNKINDKIKKHPHWAQMALVFGTQQQFDLAVSELGKNKLVSFFSTRGAMIAGVLKTDSFSPIKARWETKMDDGSFFEAMLFSVELVNAIVTWDTLSPHQQKAVIERHPDVAYTQLSTQQSIDSSHLESLASQVEWLSEPERAADVFKIMNKDQQQPFIQCLMDNHGDGFGRLVRAMGPNMGDVQALLKFMHETRKGEPSSQEFEQKMARVLFYVAGYDRSMLTYFSGHDKEKIISYFISHLDPSGPVLHLDLEFQSLALQAKKSSEFAEQNKLISNTIPGLIDQLQHQLGIRMSEDVPVEAIWDQFKDWRCGDVDRCVAFNVWLSGQLQNDAKKSEWISFSKRDDDLQALLRAHGITLTGAERVLDASTLLVNRIQSSANPDRIATDIVAELSRLLSQRSVDVFNAMVHQLHSQLMIDPNPPNRIISVLHACLTSLDDLKAHCRGSVQSLLTSIVDSTESKLDDSVSGTFLVLLDMMSDDHNFSKYMVNIIALVGEDAMSEFVFSDNQGAQRTAFKLAIENRLVNLEYHLKDSSSKFNSLRSFLTKKKADTLNTFFERQDIWDDLANLHQSHSEAFDEACFYLSQNNASRQHVFSRAARLIVSARGDDNHLAYEAIQSMLSKMDHAYRISTGLASREFLEGVKKCMGVSSVDALFKDAAFLDFLSTSSKEHPFQKEIIQRLVEVGMAGKRTTGQLLKEKTHALYDAVPLIGMEAFDHLVHHMTQRGDDNRYRFLAQMINQTIDKAPRYKRGHSERVIQTIIQQIIAHQGVSGIHNFIHQPTFENNPMKRDFLYAQVARCMISSSWLSVPGKFKGSLMGSKTRQVSLPEWHVSSDVQAISSEQLKHNNLRIQHSKLNENLSQNPATGGLKERLDDLSNRLKSSSQESKHNQRLMAHLLVGGVLERGDHVMAQSMNTFIDHLGDEDRNAFKRDCQRLISESRLKQLKAHVNGLNAVNVSSIKALVRELRWQGTQQINCRAQLLKRQHIEMKQRSGDLFYELMDFFDKYAQYTASYEVVGGDAPFGASHVSMSYGY